VRARETALPGVLVVEPEVFGDSRGFFFESFNARKFSALTGISFPFVQDNHSRSKRNVLRGLHYQVRQPQGKLVRVVCGDVFDVAADIRRSSPTFGKWEGVRLSAENQRQLWIPPGFAHGFIAMSDEAEVLNKTTDYYAPDYERCIRWDDVDLGIAWPLAGVPAVSAKDGVGARFREAELFP
jgi:dTDP-4-dehydrorhamnose 3,5-epimerase